MHLFCSERWTAVCNRDGRCGLRHGRAMGSVATCRCDWQRCPARLRPCPVTESPLSSRAPSGTSSSPEIYKYSSWLTDEGDQARGERVGTARRQEGQRHGERAPGGCSRRWRGALKAAGRRALPSPSSSAAAAIGGGVEGEARGGGRGRQRAGMPPPTPPMPPSPPLPPPSPQRDGVAAGGAVRPRVLGQGGERGDRRARGVQSEPRATPPTGNRGKTAGSPPSSRGMPSNRRHSIGGTRSCSTGRTRPGMARLIPPETRDAAISGRG